MGVLVQIRDVDELVKDRLKEHAAAKGISLNTYLRELLARDAIRPFRRDVFGRLRSQPDVVTRPGVDVLLEARAERVPK